MPRPRDRSSREQEPSEPGTAGEVRPQAVMVQGKMRWTHTQEHPILFANHVWVQLLEDHFLVTFGHVELPYGAVAEELQGIIEQEGIEVHAVCRLAVGV